MDHRTSHTTRRATARASTESNRRHPSGPLVQPRSRRQHLAYTRVQRVVKRPHFTLPRATRAGRLQVNKHRCLHVAILMGVRLAMRSFHSCDERLPPPPLRRVHLDDADPSPSMRTHSSRARSTSSARRRIPLHACPRGLRRASASEGDRRAPPRSASAPASAGSRAAAAAPNPGRQ